MIKFLVLIALLFVTPAWATECETDATVNQVHEILLCQQIFNCKMLEVSSSKEITSAVKKLTDHVSAAADKIEANGAPSTTNPTAIEFYRQLSQSMRDVSNGIDNSILLNAPHAVDFNESISRYECELTATFDVNAMKKYMRFSNYIGISRAAAGNDVSNTMYVFIMELANENNLEKMNQTLAMLFASEDRVVERVFAQPITLRYSVQTTANGTLIQVQNFADFMK